MFNSIVIARLSTNDKCVRKNDYGKGGGMQVTRPLTPRLSSGPSVGLHPGFLVLKNPSSLLGFFESVPLCWSPGLASTLKLNASHLAQRKCALDTPQEDKDLFLLVENATVTPLKTYANYREHL
ncbi:hypothetical protein CDAR_556951 [Caerostris darwini]|uniref:Uncharacterized protein n=1 Tax=Caerostris darwini TaxID=1538125 RepID=A0AAV4QJC8_9ARAC|nr:hypothetical protein CDAR_556951 [Caerostris darwini]